MRLSVAHRAATRRLTISFSRLRSSRFSGSCSWREGRLETAVTMLFSSSRDGSPSGSFFCSSSIR